ncbi:MAG: phosphonate metabolism protein/1,5-bisphosphokinase (PRPP-forming) PhnN [Rhizobiaceae bacterium]|nr:phosphonate metabolism protein/1,5-bisphosphokinase (PRPP-forming) PhnN [Rhizobiaceae bacterium]
MPKSEHNTQNRTGTLFAVVGPSGAGKDTLIDLARQLLEGDGKWHFARRHITRGVDTVGENHIVVDEREFEALSVQHAFVLQWQAHGLHYGIAQGVYTLTEQGVNVVVNLSRGAIGDAIECFSHVHVINVTAPQHVIEERLKKRGRETPLDIEERMSRTVVEFNNAAPLSTIMNDREVSVGVDQFMAILLGKNVQAA